jgi:hypothetical protein
MENLALTEAEVGLVFTEIASPSKNPRRGENPPKWWRCKTSVGVRYAYVAGMACTLAKMPAPFSASSWWRPTWSEISLASLSGWVISTRQTKLLKSQT